MGPFLTHYTNLVPKLKEEAVVRLWLPGAEMDGGCALVLAQLTFSPSSYSLGVFGAAWPVVAMRAYAEHPLEPNIIGGEDECRSEWGWR